MATLATQFSYTETEIKNLTANELYFGFIPPHGKRLAAGAKTTIKGDIYALIAGRDQRRTRWTTALQNAITNEYIRITRNVRQIANVPVGNTSVIAQYDMVYWDTSTYTVKAAADFTWTTDTATTQGNFADNFLGIAMVAHASGGGAILMPVDISPLSLWDFTCTSATHKWGDYLAPAKASGNALLSNQLVACANTVAIARAQRQDNSAVTSAFVRFTSAYFEAPGPQSM